MDSENLCASNIFSHLNIFRVSSKIAKEYSTNKDIEYHPFIHSSNPNSLTRNTFIQIARKFGCVKISRPSKIDGCGALGADGRIIACQQIKRRAEVSKS